MHLALYTILILYILLLHAYNTYNNNIRNAFTCVCRRIIENEISSSVSHEGGSDPLPWRVRESENAYYGPTQCVCVCVCVCTPLTPLFATICPNYYYCDLISGLKSFFILSAALSFSLLFLLFFFHTSREGLVYTVVYAVIAVL